MWGCRGYLYGVILCNLSPEWFWVCFKVFFVEHLFEVCLMTGCNRVFALFPYLFEFVPMFWCSGFYCLNVVLSLFLCTFLMVGVIHG